MSTPEAHQTAEFEGQSLRFVESHLHDFPDAPEWVLTSPTLSESGITSILDVGCGPGTFLASLVRSFDPAFAIGLEPSDQAAKLLNRAFSDEPRMSFQQGSAHALTFETDSFDLVVCWSVLHWVGRNEYLQALGELIRVTKAHLLVMDFVAGENYRVPYSHHDGLFTYKQDFVPAVLSSGIMTIAEEFRWWDGNRPGEIHPVTCDDLEPFAGNPLSYHARRGVLFTKNYEALPRCDAGDF